LRAIGCSACPRTKPALRFRVCWSSSGCGLELDDAIALALGAKGEAIDPANMAASKIDGANITRSKIDRANMRKRQAEGNGSGAARALLREQLRHGPKPAAQIEAAAEAAAIPESALIAAADALGVRTQRGRWWLPG
jgi:hypothetical protein